jgi:hypothetical protein
MLAAACKEGGFNPLRFSTEGLSKTIIKLRSFPIEKSSPFIILCGFYILRKVPVPMPESCN